MTASVVFLTKNPGSIFQRALHAALRQVAPWPYEVLVIDSGSRDGTVALCQAEPRVKLVTIPPAEFGHGKTRNLAFAHTTGEFVAFLTHDATPADEHWLRELVSAAAQAPDVAGAFGRHIAYEEAGPFAKRDLQRHFDSFLTLPPVVRLDDRARWENDLHHRQQLHFFSDNNACVRRSVWEKIPYPDVDFAEDQLWAKQVLEAGYAKAYADRAVVYHSHEFGCLEWLRRSFDEGCALKRLFGYQVVRSIRDLLRNCAASAWDDVQLARQQSFGWGPILANSLKTFTRQLGYFLGGRAERLPGILVQRLSRDRAMRKGTLR
jgi:rhamnosyltransferase